MKNVFAFAVIMGLMASTSFANDKKHSKKHVETTETSVAADGSKTETSKKVEEKSSAHGHAATPTPAAH